MLRSAFGKLSLVTLLLFFANFSSFAQSGPGGVDFSALWLRADSAVFSDAGTTPAVDTDLVVQWNDLSLVGNNASVGGANPTFQIGGQNGQPYLSFSDDDMDFATDGFSLGSADRSVFVVAEYPSTPGSQQYFFSYGPNVTSQRYSLGVSPSDNLIVEMQGDGITSDNTVAAASPFIFSTIYPIGDGALNTSQIFINGANSTHTGGAATPATVETSGSVGALADNAGLQFNGDIYEVIYYDAELNDAARTIVENYLSAKYDIPISNDLYAGDLIPSGDFDFDVIGIGRDAGASHIEGASGGLKLADDSFLLDDGDYVFAGHSGTSNGFSSNDLPANHNMRLARDWYIDIADATSNGGTINLEFDLAEMGLSVPTDAFSVVLITRPGTSGAYTEVMMDTGISGDIVEFYGVDVTTLVDGHKYTVAFATENGLDFDGAGDYVELFEDDLFTGDFTVEAWVYLDDFSGDYRPIITKSNSVNSNAEFNLQVQQSTGNVNFFLGNGSGISQVSGNNATDQDITLNTWTHIAAVVQGTDLFLYINGQLSGSSTFTGIRQNNANPVQIGRYFNGVTQFWDGQIDEVRIWNTARTQQQIANNAYNTILSSGTLIASYDFNQGIPGGNNGTITSLPDLTPNLNNGTLQGPFALSGNTSNWVSSTAWNADVFPPIFLSGYPLIDNISTTGFDITVQLNEPGTYYYVVVPDGATPPSVDDVRGGTGFGGTGEVAAGNINVTTPSTDFVLSPNTISHGTDYDLYIVAQDNEGSPNVQNANFFFDVTTLCDDPVVSPFITDNTNCVGGNGEITVTASTGLGEPASNYTMTIYEGVGTGGPIADVGAGTNSNVVGATGLTVSNLIPNTYTIEVINNDNGCSDISNVAVADNSTNPTISGGSIIVTNESSVGANDGTLDASGTAGGTPGPYTYQWYSDAGLTTSVGSGPSVGSLSAGTYYLEVTDNPTGCVQTTSINVLTDPPIAPDGLIAYNSSGTDITLEWSDNSSDETGFIIESSTDFAFGSPTDITSAVTPPNPGPDVTSVVYTAGVDESLYFRVSATNANGTSPSPVEFATTEAFPGHALTFDGTGDQVTFDDNQLPIATSPRAVEMWVRTNTSDINRYFFSYGTSSNGQGFSLGVSSTGTLIFTQTGSNVQSAGIINDNNWHHVAVSYDGSTYQLYIDGSPDGSNSLATNTILSGTAQLGVNIVGSNGMIGDLDEVKVWSFAKTDYSDRFTPLQGDETNLVAYYALDENTGLLSTVVDRSQNTNNGTLVGDTDFTPSTIFTDGVVSNTNDFGPGSLREAINYANANSPTTITFDIAGGGPYNIALATALPEITAAGTIIDGTTLPSWTSFGDLANMVTLDGSGLALNEGGLVVNNVANVAIYGLVFTGFSSSSESVGAIEFNGDGADGGTIGAPNNGNIFHGMNSSGIAVTHADFITVQGNRFGTTDGTARSEIGKHGIYTSGTVDNLTIGGLSGSGEGNLISGAGNGRYGIRSLAQGTNLVIQGNYIGTTSNGMASLHNEGGGVEIGGAMSFLLGGAIAGEENVISGNNTDANAKGVLIGTAPDGSIVNNIIGLAVDGVGPLGNGGPGIILNTTSAGVVVDGNIISSNGGEAITSNTGFGNVDIINNIIGFDQILSNPRPNLAGIVIDNGPGTNNRFGYKDNPNIIANNTGSAIELTATSADNTFVTNEIYNNTSGIVLAAGANGDVAVPTINNVNASTVSGSGVEGATIHLYLSDGTGQGQTFLDSAVVSGGNWSIGGLSLIITDEVVATTTDYNAGFGTSPFSATASIPVQYALDFDGTDDFASIGSNVFGGPYTGTFTVEAWVYSDLSGNNGSGIGSYGSGIFRNMESGSGATGDLALTINNVGQIGLLNWRENAVDADGHTLTDATIPANTWTHIAATWDGAVNRIYINGVEQSFTQNGTSTGWGVGYEIGRVNSAVQWHYDGEMDELRVWNVARSETEINDNRFSELNPGAESDLVAYYQFNSASGTNVVDSKNANDGTWSGSGGTNTTPNWIPSTALTQPPNIVTNVNDAGPGSLREAIIYANANPGTTITFDIAGAGPWPINVASELPEITANGTIIDGTTQLGWNMDAGDMVTLDGTSLALASEHGLTINAANVEIYGLLITNFPGSGIISTPVSSSAAIIGDVGKGNVINNNDLWGVGLGWTNSFIVGNRIGTNSAGTAAAPNGSGGVALPNNTTVTDNLISGHNGSNDNGIFSNTTGGHLIANNLIGTDITGSFAIPNDRGVAIVTGGGSKTIDNNLISGNTEAGIWSNGGFSDNDIINNIIGMDSTLSSAIPNGIGILYASGSGNRIGYKDNPNVIAGNTGAAIETTSAASVINSWVTNEIYGNGSGIVFTAGANNGILPPSIDNITSTDASGSGTNGDMIHLYYSDASGQGQAFLDSVLVSGGTWNISGLSLSGGDELVATATNATDGTSEFSAAATFTFNYPTAEGAGEALYFDGVDDYVDISSFDVDGWNEIMVEAWIKPDVIPGGPGNQYATIVGKGSYGAAGNTSFALYLFGSDGSPFSELRARVDNGTQVEEVTYDANNLFAGEWVHVAMSWTSGNAVELYVNGELVDSSSPLSGTINAVGDNILIGSSSNGSELLFEGEIDEVKIWDKRLQENGIRQYLAKKVTDTHPDFSNLVAYYRMDDSGDALNLTDYKGANNGTIEGVMSYVLSGAHVGDDSFYDYLYSVGEGRNLDNFRVSNLGTANLPLHIYRVSGTPANNTIAGFNNIADTAYYGVFAPGQTYDVSDSIGNLTSDRRIVFRNDGADPTWTSISGPLGVDVEDDQIYAYGQFDNGQFATAIDQNPYPTPVDAGYALRFDGVDDEVIMTGGDTYDFIQNSAVFSFEFWLKINDLAQLNQVIASTAFSTLHRGFFINYANTGYNAQSLRIAILRGASGQYVIDANTPANYVDDTNWHHYAIVSDGSNLTIYKDGVPTVLGAIGTLSAGPTTNDFALGTYDGQAGSILDGDLDEVRIWDIPLSETNIRDHMIAKIDPDFDSLNHLQAYFRFDENSGSVATNLAGDSDGTVTGATPVISGAPQGQGSIYSYAAVPGSLKTDQFGEDVNIFYDDATGGIHGYVVQGNPNQLQADGFDDLDQGKYYGVFAPGGQKVDIRMDYNGANDSQRRIVYRKDASDNAASGGWERLSGLINTSDVADSVFAYNVPTGEVSTAVLNPASSYLLLGDTDPGSALDFDGADDYVRISQSENLNFEFDDPLSLEAWINAPSSGTWTLLSKISSGPTRGYRITLNSQVLSLQLFSDGGASNEIVVTAVEPIPIGSWHHLAVTYDGSNTAAGVALYLDGTPLTNSVSNDNLSGTIQNGEDFLIGIRNDLTSPYQGQMDEVRIWNAPVAAGDIAAYANTTDISSHPNYSDMVAYYKFDDGTGSMILEDVFANNDGTLTNMDENTDWVGSGALANAPEQNALNYDGIDDFVSIARQNLAAGLTYEAWINTTSAANTTAYDGNPALTVIGDNDNSIEGAFGIHDGKVRYTHWTGSGIIFDQIDGSVDVNDGLWHHIAVTHEQGSNEVRLYVDGVLDLVSTSTIYSTGISANRIGSSYLSGGGNDNFFTGEIDEVRIWDTVLSEDEIRDNIYAGDLSGHTNYSNLLVHYGFNQGSDAADNSGLTTLNDISSYGNNGTLNNFTLNGPTSNWVASGIFNHTPVASSTQASNLIPFGVTENSVNLTWTNGNGQRRIVAVFEGIETEMPIPSDNQFFNADPMYLGDGDIVDGSWYAAYNGYGNAVTITGLTPGTDYTIAVLEVNGPPTYEAYNSGADTNNPVNFSTNVAAVPFITTWVTSDGQITIPTFSTGYDYTVDWFNETNPGTFEGGLSNQTGDAILTGLENGSTYRVEISGQFPRIYFNNAGDKDKIQTVEQWGDIAWSSMQSAFNGCSNLIINATDVPDLTTVTIMGAMFYGCTSLSAEDLSNWDVSNVSNFVGLFKLSSFDGDISNWNMISANSIATMFEGTPFNGDITGWTVDNVENMNGMFFNNSTFDQDISGWTTSSVTSMFALFQGASSFDQNLGVWDIQAVTNMTSMFDNSGLSTANYDATLAGWAIQSVQNGVTLGADGLIYSSVGETSRDLLVNAPNDWVINGDMLQTGPDAVFTSINVPGGNLSTGTTDNLVYKFSISAAGGDITKEGFSVAVGGDATTTDFSANGWKLYESPNVDTGVGGASLIGSTNIGDILPDTVAFGMSGNILDGDTHYFYLTVDVDAAANNGNSFNVVLWSPDPLESIGIADPKNKVDGGFVDGETFTIQSGDVTPPTPVISSTESNPTNANPILIDFDFGESVTGFTQADITVSNGTKQNFNNVDGQIYSVEIVPTSDGLITIDLAAGRVQDLAGNGNLVAAQFTIIYDGTDPSITLDQDGLTVNDTNLSGTISDPTDVIQISVDGGATLSSVSNEADGTWSYPLDTDPNYSGDGIYNIYLDAVDVLGNQTLFTTGSVTIDQTAPIVSVDETGTSIRNPLITGEIDDPLATIEIEVDGESVPATNNGDGTWALIAGSLSSGLADGTYDVIATTTDVAGNVGTDNTSDELIISQTVVALSPSDINSTGFTAHWSTGLDVQNYQVDISSSSDFSNFVEGFENFETTATGVFVTNLDFSTNYYYRVRLVNTNDVVSANSNTRNVKTTVDLETLADSLALVQIYDALAPQGLNWETERLRDWDGVTLDINRTRVDIVNIGGTQAAGNMPNPFTGDALSNGGLNNLTGMDVSDNEITGLMDFSSSSVSTLFVNSNGLEFDDLEPIAALDITTLDYSDQTSVQFNEATEGSAIEVRYTNDYSLSTNIGGSDNQYSWFRNNNPITTGSGFIVSGSEAVISSINYDNMGEFRVEVTNTLVPGLTIEVDPQIVWAVADMQVLVSDSDGNSLSAPFDATMLETTRTATGFRELEKLEGVNSSTFTFPDVVLGNYIIFVESDLELYIPTYYGDVFEWTEADTLFFRSDDVIEMTMTEVPPELVEGDGDGSLDVLIEEDFGDDEARVDARRRAAKRKCGLRKRRRGGRTGQDDDEFELIAYGETDENGEFQFGFLPEGTYRFFVEYPGIPLDDSSFVEFEVGEAGVSDTDFKLAAFATEDGIEISIEAVLGIILEYFKDLQIYPNPSSEYLNIQYRHLKSGDVTAQLVDLAGNTKWSEDLRNGFNGELRIDVSDYEEGIYILRFYDRENAKDNVVSFRVIVRD